MRVVELAGIDDLSGEDVSLEEMRMQCPESLRVLDVLKGLVCERNFRCLEVSRGIGL